MNRKIVLGDNPFFGINHRSGSKAAEYSKMKSDFSKAASVITKANRLGIDRLMVSTHAELTDLLNLAAKHMTSENIAKPKLSLVVPYAHKLNSVVADKGVLGLFSLIKPSKLLSAGCRDFLSFVFKQRKFPKHIFAEFISSELSLVDDYDVEYVCFQNVVTDMILGLDKSNIFDDIVESLNKTGISPLFITMNPIALDKLLPKGVPICFHYNVNGFMVQPSLNAVQQFISSTDRPIWAMGVMASGAIDSDSVWKDPYLDKFDKILYATSKPERLDELVNDIERLNK